MEVNKYLSLCIMAYRKGQVQPISMSAGATGELYQKISQEFIKKKLTPSCHQNYTQLRDRAREAVNLAQKGNFNESKLRFKEIEEELNKNNENEEVCLLGLSWLHQGKAYLESRLHNWKAGRDCLHQAMLNDLQLEQEYNYSIFHIARVHLVYLFVRLELMAGNLDKAMILVQEINEYVTGNRDNLSMGKGWSKTQAMQVPLELRQAMIVRIASEAGTIMAIAPKSQKYQLFRLFFHWLEYKNDPVLSEIYQWGIMTEAFLENKIDIFLSQSIIILSAGRKETCLWYDTVLNLFYLCQQLRPKQTHLFLKEIICDAKQWANLPNHLFPPGMRIAFQKLELSNNDITSNISPTVISRFQLYSVGLPRTGTTSLSTLFGMYRSANEYMEQETISKIIAHHFCQISDQDFYEFLTFRVQQGQLEMDAASFNHFYLDFLVKKFPEAKFIFTIRDPYSWINSYMNMLLRWKQKFGVNPPQWTTNYGKMLFGNFNWNVFNSTQELNHNLDSMVIKFLCHWTEANRRILNLLPQERSVIIKTQEISYSLENIANFVNIHQNSLTDKHHSNRSSNNINLLESINKELFKEECQKLANDIIKRTGIDIDVETP